MSDYVKFESTSACVGGVWYSQFRYEPLIDDREEALFFAANELDNSEDTETVDIPF